VRGLRFTDHQTLVWDPERSIGTYSLYRGLLDSLAGYGDCEQQDLEGETTEDSSPPPTGAGYFYLVTASNRLDDEGTLGWDSAGAQPQLRSLPLKRSQTQGRSARPFLDGTGGTRKSWAASSTFTFDVRRVSRQWSRCRARRRRP